MPFKTAKQEIAMMINSPSTWRKWVNKYGHHKGFHRALSKKRAKARPKRGKRRR